MIETNGFAPIDWRDFVLSGGILAKFPQKPTHDDLVDLWEKNRTLRSNLIDTFLRRLASIARH